MNRFLPKGPSFFHTSCRVTATAATSFLAIGDIMNRTLTALLFAGLLAGVVGVAGIGLWQTRRAFLRQLALNEEKTNFVSAVSHELRSPLASLRLLSEALAEGRAEDPAKRREYAAFLVQETRRLGTLVENVLDFSRIEQGRKVYLPEPIDLPRLVHETVRILGPVAEEREQEREPVVVAVDCLRLKGEPFALVA
mgnify:CR=1 FL=1